MNTLLVGYDLNRPGQNYTELIKYLKSQGTWWHYLDSTWLIVTSISASELRDEIKRLVDSGDEVLVLSVKGDAWVSFGFSDRANKGLKEHI